MGNVHVTTQYKLALAFERHQVRVDQRQKAELGLLALFPRRATWKVATDHRQFGFGCVKTQLHVTAFGVKLTAVKTGDHLAGLMAAIGCYPRIPFFLGKVEVTL